MRSDATVMKAARADESRVSELAALFGYMTEREFCLLLDITQSTAETWRKRHTGPAYSLAGTRYLYPLDAVEAFIDEQIRQPKATGKAAL